ncbi:hypothetical protein [Streptomyces sp. NPDC058374]|uniref:LppU/SCO3897 family protein n=1 Tax=unclassified Streptomyces TaxID=2593676 RepID=UPI0036505D0A
MGRRSRSAPLLGALLALPLLVGCGGSTDVSVGDCLANDGTLIDPDLRPVDCSSREATFRVAEKLDRESDCLGLYFAYQESGLLGGTTTLCLALKLF